jgi:uncharacterized membrane protein
MLMIIVGLFALGVLLLPIVGFILSIMALVATKHHGREGIFWKALVGTCLNGLIIFFTLIILINGLNMMRQKAQQTQQTQQMEQRQ